MLPASASNKITEHQALGSVRNVAPDPCLLTIFELPAITVSYSKTEILVLDLTALDQIFALRSGFFVKNDV